MAKAERLPLGQAWKNWDNCLRGNDINSILEQISLMIWDTAIFHIIAKSRQIHFDKNPDSPEVNDSLHSFIDRNYFQTQAAFIRRLTDKSYGLTGKRGVYSVGALIKDIHSYRNDLTREEFFKLRNMPYDYTEIQNKEFDWESIAEAHQTFDRLSGTTQNNRKPDDLIAEKVFVRLQEKLAACQGIVNYVDKFAAHSATPESRVIQDIKASEVTFRHLWEAHQIIFEVAEFISGILFSESHMALPIENPSFFELWETPLYEEEEVDLVRITLEDYRKETRKWDISGIDDIWQWIEA